MLTVDDDKSLVSDNQTYKPNEANLFRSEIDFMNKIQESNKQHQTFESRRADEPSPNNSGNLPMFRSEALSFKTQNVPLRLK